jgi:hypothetical protein
MRKLTKWLLFIFSYTPIFLVVVIKNINLEKFAKCIVSGNISFSYIEYCMRNLGFKEVYLSFLIILILLSIFTAKNVLKQSDGFVETKVIKRIEKANSSISDYFIVYVLALSFSSLDIKEIIIFWIIICIAGTVNTDSWSIYKSPIIKLILGYNVYEAELSNKEKCIVLSKLDVYELNSFVGSEVKLSLLSDEFSSKTYKH